MAAGTPRRIRVERGLYRRGRTYFACTRPRGAPRPLWRSLGEVGILEARRLRDAFVVEMRNGGRPILDRTTTVDEVAADALLDIADRVKRGKLGRRTEEAYRSNTQHHVVPFFAGVPVSQVTPDDIAEWVTQQEASDAAAWSVRGHWTALRMVFKHAQRRGIIDGSPAEALKPHEKPGPGRSSKRFLDRDEIAALFKAATTLKERTMLALLILSGLRAAEALGLNWKELDVSGRWIKVRYQMSRDGERVPIKMSQVSDAGPRDVVMMDALVPVVRHLRVESAYSQDHHLVLVNSLGNTWGYWELLDAFTDLCRRAGILGATPHSGRHTFASILIDQGHPVEFVSRQLGHAKTSTTYDVYTHLFRRREHADAARDGLNRGFGGMLGGS